MIRDLIIRNRSCRRFNQRALIKNETLRELVDLARMSPSGGNLQPLKYILSSNPIKNARIFKHLSWAAYLSGWSGPDEGQRPAGYIIILGDKEISFPLDCDHGIAAQSILLGAVEKDLAGCIIGSVRRDELSKLLDIPDQYHILLVLALGQPAEEIVLEPTDPSGDIHYWRDAQGTHHVPKRPIDEIIVAEY